jgi:hypothetical protein
MAKIARFILIVSALLAFAGCASFWSALGAFSAGYERGGGYSTVSSTITSDFSGLNYGNVYTLWNGQVWQQTEYYVWYYYWYNPNVLIWYSGGMYYMKVQGIEHAVAVSRIQ